jgi:hypothetical protein
MKLSYKSSSVLRLDKRFNQQGHLTSRLTLAANERLLHNRRRESPDLRRRKCKLKLQSADKGEEQSFQSESCEVSIN